MKVYAFAALFLVLVRVVCAQSVSFTSSNLPVIVIDTEGQTIWDDPKIMASMGIVYNGVGVRNQASGPFTHFEGKIGIEIRGSSSQTFPKKQYGVELWDDQANGLAQSLLGMPAEEDWVLFAPYNDKTLMRDVLAYKLGRDLGHYASRTRYVEVVLNNQYQGVYVLIEKIKRDKNRVDINKLDPDEISGDDLTGGYIIKLDKTTGDSGAGWYSPFPPNNRGAGQRIMFQYEYPKHDEITPEQKTYIQQSVGAFEAALKSANFADPVEGYAKYIDVPSFIDFFIMNEVSKNVDGYRLSTYLHKQRASDGGKIFMGPIWDFNLGFGNADYCTSGNPEGFAMDFNDVCNDDYSLIPFWWGRLLQDENFRRQLNERWAVLRATTLQTTAIRDYIDSVALALNESQQRNFQRWPVLGQYVWPNYFVGSSFEQEVTWLKNWVSQRLTWLDTHLPSTVTDTEKEHPLQLAVYPNPTPGVVHVDVTLQRPAAVEAVIYNAQGSVVQTYTAEHAAGKNTLTITLPGTAGFFFYDFRANGVSVTRGKLLKQ